MRVNEVYQGDTFKVVLKRYTDPDRSSLAENSAIYLGREDRDNKRRPLSIIRQGHVLEVFRGEFAEFEFIDVSKEVYDHLQTYTTRNLRVAGGLRGNKVDGVDDYTLPSDRMKDPERVRIAIESSLSHYHELLESGETPQVSRSAFPINGKLPPFVISFNFQTLIESLFTQRIWEKGAQGNTVKVVRAMFILCHAIDPELWETAVEYYGPHVKEWKDAQKKLRKEKMTVGQFYKMVGEMLFKEESVYKDMTVEEFIRERLGQTRSMWE